MTSCSMKATRHQWIPALLVQVFLVFTCQTAVTTAQQWTQKPQDQMVGVGGVARFVCRSSPENTNIFWTKGAVALFANGQRFSNSVSQRYNLDDPFTLTISNVQQEDNGMYGCNIQDFGSASANLTVLLPPGPPSITAEPSNAVFEEEQTVAFSCSSSGGNPPPTINWAKNGVEVLTSGLGQTTTEGVRTHKTLTVKLDHSDHQANYTCFVYNRVNQNNSLTASTILNVRYSPIVTFDPQSPYAVRQGQEATVRCQVDANPSVTSVNWQKDGQTIPGTKVVKTFSPVRRQDSGNYTCIASNSLNAGNPSRNTIRVDVVYPPVVTVPAEKNVPEFSRVTLNCDVDANPFPYQIVWELVLPNGVRRQKSNSDVLEFGRISRMDAGNYTCKASSLLRVSGVSTPETVFGEGHTVVNVQYAPGPATIAPIDNIDVGQRLQLTCSATPEGYPRAQFRWRRNGAEQSERSSTYVIQSATLSDSANYSCTPYNVNGQGTPDYIVVSINEPPRLLRPLLENMTRTITNTQPLSLTCKGQGRPQPVIEWFKDNMTDTLLTVPEFYHIRATSKAVNAYSTEVTSTLLFKGPERAQAPSGERVRLRMEDLGSYTCRVRSPAHDVTPSSSMQLYVQFAPVVAHPSQKIAVTIADRTYLPCQAQAFPPPVFQWYRDGKLISPQAAPRFEEQRAVVSGAVSAYRSTLIIQSVGAEDYGLYYCFVSNPLDNVTSVVNITTKSTPEAPTSLQTLGRTWESIHLQWTPGFDGGFSQNFQVSVQEFGSGEGFNVPSSPMSVTDLNITGLKPSTRYEFCVFSTNELGVGPKSVTITSQTWELEIPTLGEAVPVFYKATKQLVIPAQPSGQYCLRIDARVKSGAWQSVKRCTRVLGGGSLEVPHDGVTAVNVSVCLLSRPEVCGPPMKAEITCTWTERSKTKVASGGTYNSGGAESNDACKGVCGDDCVAVYYDPGEGTPDSFRCKTFSTEPDQSAFDDNPVYTSSYYTKTCVAGQSESSPVLTVNDVIIIACVCAFIIITLLIILICFICRRRSSAKDYENTALPPSASNGGVPGKKMQQGGQAGQPQSYDNADGRPDAFRGQQESIGMHGRPLSPKDKYLDLEDPNDPSLQSQESGYSTGDPNSKPKKVIYEVVV